MYYFSDLFFLNYNNYYNRKLKRSADFLDYTDYIVHTETNKQFKANEYIYTTVELSFDDYTDDLPAIDYMLQCKPNYTTGKEEIISRWYITNMTRLRSGKFEAELFRDTLADYFEVLQNSPIFVEKAMLPVDSPLIFNKEDMTFNQIRQEPKLLGDKTNMPWIIGYIPRDSFKESKQVVADMNLAGVVDLEVENIADWPLYTYTVSDAHYQGKTYVGFNYGVQTNPTGVAIQNNNSLNTKYVNVSDGTVIDEIVEEWSARDYESLQNGYYNNNSYFQGTYYYNPKLGNLWKPNKKAWAEYAQSITGNTLLKSYIDGYITSSYRVLNEVQYDEIMEANNKVIYDSTADRYYKVSISVDANESVKSIGTSEPTIVAELRQSIPDTAGGQVTTNTFTIRYDSYKLKIDLVQVQAKVFVNIDDDRYHLEDQPYDMFCIPYGNITMVDNKGEFNARNPGTAIASEIAAYAGVDSVYDVQLLPYCPIQGLVTEDNEIDLSKTKYDLIYETEGKLVSAIIWCSQSSFSFTIPLSIPDKNTAIERKIASETELYRLVSPNYASMFEFNPYKNGGVDYLRVDCSYRPYNPFIKVAPVFKGLYGKGGLYDGRGLILNGDFSLTQLSNAWSNYELQNKNYQAIFDRQIQHMEVENKWQHISDVVGATAGAVSTGVSGMMMGSLMSTSAGAAGGIIGAAVGGTAGVATGIFDIVAKEKLRNEAIDYTKDNFGYNLGNIQALPTSLTKTASIAINNPILPMLEVYTCTDVERIALQNKIIYNGMTVMTIGTLNDYTEGYFKGKLIRLEGIGDNYAVINTIASELYKGVYLS